MTRACHRTGQFDSFTQHVHSSLETRRVAFTLANEGRALIGCDRTSVALVHGRKARLLSISGVDTLNRRAASVRDLESLIAAVVAVDEPLWYPQDAALAAANRTSFARLSRPVARSAIGGRALARAGSRRPGQHAGGRDRCPGMRAFHLQRRCRTDEGADLGRRAQGTVALANALEYEGVPLVRLWRALGQSRRPGARVANCPRPCSRLVAVAALVAALLYVQIDFTVAGRGASCPSTVVTCSPPSTA